MRHTQALLIAVLSALLISDAWALGLGPIQVHSALNQPFAAEIELSDVQPDELDTVKVRLADESDFRKVGIALHHFLTGLRFNPGVSQQGRPVIRVTSNAPIREPYIGFVLEVNWPKGRFVREYAVHLNTPANVRMTARGRTSTN